MGAHAAASERVDMNELEAVFELVDIEGEGTLDREGLARLCFYFQERPLAEEELSEAMERLDYDDMGEVDFDDFCTWFLQERTC